MHLSITKTSPRPTHENDAGNEISKTIEFFTADTYSKERSALWKGITSAFDPTQYKIQDIAMMGAVFGIGLVASGGLLGFGLGALGLAGDLMSAAHIYSAVQQITTERDEHIRLAAFGSLGSNGVNAVLSGLLIGAGWLTRFTKINPLQWFADFQTRRKARVEAEEISVIHGAANRIIEVIERNPIIPPPEPTSLALRPRRHPAPGNLTFACVTPPRYTVNVSNQVVSELKRLHPDTKFLHILSLEEPNGAPHQVAATLQEILATDTHILVTIPVEEQVTRMLVALSKLHNDGFQGRLTIISGNSPGISLPITPRASLKLETDTSSGMLSLVNENSGGLSLAHEEGGLSLASNTPTRKIEPAEELAWGKASGTPEVFFEGEYSEATSLGNLVDWANKTGKFVHIDLKK